MIVEPSGVVNVMVWLTTAVEKSMIWSFLPAANCAASAGNVNAVVTGAARCTASNDTPGLTMPTAAAMDWNE